MNTLYSLLKKMSCSMISFEEIQKIHQCDISFLRDMKSMSIILEDQNGRFGLTRLSKLIFTYILETIVFSKSEIYNHLNGKGFSISGIDWILDWLVDLNLLRKNDDEFVLGNNNDVEEENNEVIVDKKLLKQEQKEEFKTLIKSVLSVKPGEKKKVFTIRGIALLTKIKDHIVRGLLEELISEKYVLKMGWSKPYGFVITSPEEQKINEIKLKLSTKLSIDFDDKFLEYVFNMLQKNYPANEIASILNINNHSYTVDYYRSTLISRGRIDTKINEDQTKTFIFRTKSESEKLVEEWKQSILLHITSCNNTDQLWKKTGLMFGKYFYATSELEKEGKIKKFRDRKTGIPVWNLIKDGKIVHSLY
jgi:hypothetical protein